MRHERTLLFSVKGLHEEPDRLFVGGRNCGDLIRVGDEFTQARQDDRPSDSDRPVLLRLKSILLYGKYMNQIDPGMTAELELERLGDARPALGEFLAGTSALPAYPDYEILGEGEFTSKPG